MEPQLDFRRQLEWEMVENALDENTEDVGVDGRRIIVRRGGLGYHEIVTAPTYCGNGLLMRINSGGSIRPTIIRYATAEAAISKKIQVDITDVLRDFYYVLSVM